MSESKTPRTDAFEQSCMTYRVLVAKKSDGRNEKANLQEIEWVLAIELARTLETELAAAREDAKLGALLHKAWVAEYVDGDMSSMKDARVKIGQIQYDYCLAIRRERDAAPAKPRGGKEE